MADQYSFTARAWERIGLYMGDVGRGLLQLGIRRGPGKLQLQLGEWQAWAAQCAGAMVVMVALYWVYMLWPVRLVRHIKCPPYWLPGVGHLPWLGKKEAQVFIDMARQYGPVYRFHFGRQPIIMIADAELCRLLCTKYFKAATDRANPAYIETVPLLQHALFFSRGKAWSLMRNTVLPFYHSEQMRKYVPLMNRIGDVLVQLLRGKSEKEDVNISHYMMMLTLDVIGATAFGAKFEMLEGLGSPENERRIGEENHGVTLDAKLVQATNKFIDSLRLDGDAPLSTIIGELFPIIQKPMRKLLGSIPGTADWEMEEQTRALMRVLKEMLKQRQAEGNVNRRIDMLSLLLNARKEKSELTEDYVNGLTFETLLVGSETTAVTMSYCLYFVACHPQVEEKILKEVDAFGPRESDISYEDLMSKFPYVEQVFKETLRFCTPAPVIARLITNDIKIGEYELKKGTHVWLTPNAVMMDKRNFKDPNEFNPDRFDADCPENKERHPSAYMPFGLGARACIGSKFATQEAKIALIKLYQNFTFTHSPTMEKPLAFNFGIVRRPKYGIKLRVHPRY